MESIPTIENLPQGVDVFFIPPHSGKCVLLQGDANPACLADSDMISAMQQIIANAHGHASAIDQAMKFFNSLPQKHPAFLFYQDVLDVSNFIHECSSLKKLCSQKAASRFSRPNNVAAKQSSGSFAQANFLR